MDNYKFPIGTSGLALKNNYGGREDCLEKNNFPIIKKAVENFKTQPLFYLIKMYAANFRVYL